MKKNQMDKYIWMYLDGEMNPDEKREFLKEVSLDDQLGAELEAAKQIDELLKGQPIVLMPESTRAKITAGALAVQIPEDKLTAWWSGKDLKSFIFMNVAILVLGLFFTWIYGSESVAGKDRINWSAFFEVLNKPYIRLFSLLCVGTFSLLLMDYFLKVRPSHRYNYVE